MSPSVENAGAPAAGPHAVGAPPAPGPSPAPDRADEEGVALAAPAPAADEEGAWAEVEAAWDDEARHRAYLARFGDLEGLAVAGRRYRAALAARPADALAARFRDEVIRRATAQGLAALPRGAPAGATARRLGRVAVALLLAALAFAAFLLLRAVAGQLGAAL